MGHWWTLILACITTLAATAHGAPQPVPTAPSVTTQWQTANQNIQTSASATNWTWLAPAAGSAGAMTSQGIPALRVHLDVVLPRRWYFIQTLVQSGAKFIKRAPILNSDKTRFVLELNEPLAHFEFEFEDKDKILHRVSLDIKAQLNRPYFVSHASCADYNIRLKAESENRVPHFFIGMACSEDSDRVFLYFVRSGDIKWDMPGLEAERAQPSFVLRVRKPQESVLYDEAVTRVVVENTQGEKQSHAIYYVPKERPRRWDLTVGLAGSYLHYKESAQFLSLTEGGLTGKLSFGYRLIPKLLSADLTTYGTLGYFGVSPSSRQGARFLGVNGRLGYRLPIDLGATEWFFLGGWYWWDMYVSDNSYGLNSVQGPQIFIQLNYNPAGGRALYSYVKFALVTDLAAPLVVNNNEMALGGGIGITRGRKPFLLTVDFSRFEFEKGVNEAILYSASFGIAKRF